MKTPLRPSDERERQKALDALRMLDTGAEQQFDQITELNVWTVATGLEIDGQTRVGIGSELAIVARSVEEFEGSDATAEAHAREHGAPKRKSGAHEVASRSHGHDHAHGHADHLAIEGFTSLSFSSDGPFALRKFQNFLDNQLPAGVFRAKGILWFNESERRHVFHLAGKRFSIDDSDWSSPSERRNQLVLIGKQLDHAKLRKQLQACVAKDAGKGFR